MPDSEKHCFVISPIGDDGTEVRGRSDRVLEHVIRPAVEQECKYKVTRSDEISTPGLITIQIMDRLRDDDLVVADLTGRNANVFYELAVRHAVGKPVIQIMEQGEEPPFDLADMRTIFVDYHDLKSASDCQKAIIAAVREIESGSFRVVSPISYSVDLQELARSGDANSQNAQLLQQIGSHLATQSATIRDIQRELAQKTSQDNAVGFGINKPAYLAGSLRHSLNARRPNITGFVILCDSCGSSMATDATFCSDCGNRQEPT